MKVLQIVESAYRGTLEEQDDTIIWLMQALLRAGADLSVLLRGNAVNYGVRNLDASGLCFGALEQTQPPCLAEEVAELLDRGTAVYVVEEDLAERGIDLSELIPGLKGISRGSMAALLGQFDQVWK